MKLYYKTYLKNLNRALLCCKVRKEVPRVLKKSGETLAQPRPQGLLLVQNGGQRNPWPRLPKWLQKFVRISLRKHDEMSSFCLINGFRLQKTNRATRRWKQPSKKPFHHCHVTKYSTIRGVFQQPWPGVSPTAIWSEEKALETRLTLACGLCFWKVSFKGISLRSEQSAYCNFQAATLRH